MRWLPTGLACALLAAPVGASLPAAFDRGVIEQCVPTSLQAAADCLRRALGADGIAEIARQDSAADGAELRRLLYDAWDIANPRTPLAADMRRRDLYYPGLVPSLIVMDVVQRANGQRPNWRAVAAAVRSEPLMMRMANQPPYVPPSATAGGRRLPAEECAEATGDQYENVEACYRMPDGSLIVRTAHRIDRKSDAD